MSKEPENHLSRRKFLLTVVLGLAALPMAALARPLSLLPRSKARLIPTVHIEDEHDPTPSAEEGPFYKSKNPERKSLIEKGMTGTKLIVVGQVLDTQGKPVANALLDFWHCDPKGDYDNEGFKLRGHQFTDKEGKYRLETLFPGEYPGRTRHIHVRAQAPHKPILTTQLFFPNEARNKRDGIYRRDLEMKIKEIKEAKQGTFNFVLDLG